MKKIIIFMMLLICAVSLNAQQKTINTDPLDLSEQKEQIEKLGVPTINVVDEMKTKADALYNAGSWQEAAEAYELYANNVNWLANLLAQCVEPYYDASYDKKKAISYATLKPFIPFETKANECKQNRNRAYVRIGLCYKNMGDIKNAVIYLDKSLDLLDVDDMEYWTQAKDAMSNILKFNIE